MRPYNHDMRGLLIVLFTILGGLLIFNPSVLAVLIAAPSPFVGRLLGAVLLAVVWSLIANETFPRLFNFTVGITSFLSATGQAIAAFVFMGTFAWSLIAWPLLILAGIAFLLAFLG
jgi:hypothetical protein